MLPKLSIIIPVYNTSKYLPECLDSVINQTLKEIEIICIDDCSTDDSWKILQDYEKKDSRIKIFRQGKNMRQGAARNRGLKEASGKYIWFIDSDDFINKEACQLLYDTAEKNNVQILTFNLVSFIDSDEVSDKEAKKYIEDIYYYEWPKNINLNPKIEYKKLNGHFTVSPCSYISRRDYISQFTFRENCLYEDTDFSLIALAECDTLHNIEYSAYHRRIASGSTMTSSFTVEKLCDLIKVLTAISDYINNMKVSRNSFVYQFYLDYINHVFYNIEHNSNLQLPESELNKINELKKQEEQKSSKLNVRFNNKLKSVLNRILSKL